MKRKDLFTLVKSTIDSSTKDDVGLLSAGLTYYVFLSLFPLLLLGLMLATLFVSESEAAEFIFSEVAKVIPGAMDLLQEVVTAAYDNRGGALIISLVVLAFSASNAFGTLDKAVNRAWGTEKMPNLVIAKLFSFLMMGILGVMLILSVFVSIALTFVQESILPSQITEVKFVLVLALIPAQLVTSVGFVFVGFLLMYRFLPRANVRFSDVWLAALAASLAWELVKLGFTIYIGSSFANYNAIYGTLGTVVALLFWLYISSMVILYGAEFAAEVYHLRITRESEMGRSGQSDMSVGQDNKQDKKASPWFKYATDNTRKV